MFDRNIYIERRRKLKIAVGSGLILFLGNDQSSINFKDNLYHFRQDSSFLYFFGIDRPGLYGIIDIDNNNEILFGDDLTVEQMVWTGYQLRLAEQADRIGVTMVKRLNELELFIQKVRAKYQKIHFLPPYRPEHLQKLSSLLEITETILFDIASIELIQSIVSLRSVKALEEVEEISKGVNITVDMQLKAMHFAKEGMTEAKIAGELQSIAISSGGDLSFPTILTVNGQILHNHYSNTILKNGALVLCDCGAETGMHYAGDLTRTFPVGNKFSSIQRDIYAIVLNAHTEAVNALQPGKLFKEIHLLACEKLVEGLQQIGLMKGNAKEAVMEGAHALFFPCGLGHMMGLDVHDMENLGEQYVGYTDALKKSTQFGLKSLRLGRALEPGFVVTVEPGLYFIKELIDQWNTQQKFTDFINYDQLDRYKDFGGIRVEEDFLITSNGHRLLGKELPKSPEEIESLRG